MLIRFLVICFFLFVTIFNSIGQRLSLPTKQDYVQESQFLLIREKTTGSDDSGNITYSETSFNLNGKVIESKTWSDTTNNSISYEYGRDGKVTSCCYYQDNYLTKWDIYNEYEQVVESRLFEVGDNDEVVMTGSVKYSYEPHGHVNKEEYYDGDGNLDESRTLYHETYYNDDKLVLVRSYDENGAMIGQVTFAFFDDGSVMESRFVPNDDSEICYLKVIRNAEGSILEEESRSKITGELFSWVFFEYDEDNRPVKVKRVDEDGQVIEEYSLHYEFTYDENGNLSSMKQSADFGDVITEYTYVRR